MHKIGQSGGFLGRLLGPLLKPGLPFLAAVLAIDAAIQENVSGSGLTTLIISHEERNDIMKIDKPLEESGLLIKSVSETTKNESKEQKGGFLGMLLGTLGAILLGNLLTGKGTIRGGEETIRSGPYF